jgi:amidase
MNVVSLSASAAAARIREGSLTSEQLVLACAARIQAREDVVGAWEFFDLETALQQARRLDRIAPDGPLHGVPVGVKDLIDTVDMPTAYGSPIYAGHRPIADAACVQRLRAAGAVVMGKTVTTEFAIYHPGKTTNPANPLHTPGGSSSGSAAAVADGMVPLALGTQTGASVIRPASYCGVFGFKPSAGAVDRAGTKSLSASLDTIGFFAKNVDDLVLVAQAMSDVDPAVPSARITLPIRYRADSGNPVRRVAFVRTGHWLDAEPDTRRALESLAHLWGSAGEVVVDELALPASFDTLSEAAIVIMEVEVAQALQWEYQTRGTHLSPDLDALLKRGSARSLQAYQQALETAARCKAEMGQIFGQHDVLLTPSVTGEAPFGLASTGDAIFGRGWTLLGMPCVSVPGLTGSQGLPLGVQLVGPRHGDHLALAGARALAEHLQISGAAPSARP